MKLEYISHSSFVIHTSNSRIVFDPWYTPHAYNKQWYLHPKPLDDEPARNADVVLISHGHEDHLNHDSLKLIQKNAHIFFPFQWRKGVVDYLHHLGFSKVTEALSFKSYHVDDAKISYLGYSLESVIVVECEGFVIVNINDALNSNHETAVSYLLDEIHSRWPKIDFLLSGWSGAGYFPNKVQYKDKDDLEVARIREQYFANNFCRFTKHLQPEIAIAFAPGFVLLNDENRWINEIKFPREILEQYYHDNFDGSSTILFPHMYPGDYLIDKKFFKMSPLHFMSSEKELYNNIDNEFKNEIEEANRLEYANDDEIYLLKEKLIRLIDKNKKLYHPEVTRDAIFSVQFNDVLQKPFFNIHFENSIPKIERGEAATSNDRLIITTKAKLLSLNLEKPWGGDLLTIGYGINVEVFDELSLEKNLDIVCVRLISRYPDFKEDFIRHSGRMIKYYVNNPSLTNLWIRQKISLRPYVNKYPFNERDHWITYNKCNLCKVCKMPEVDFNLL